MKFPTRAKGSSLDKNEKDLFSKIPNKSKRFQLR